ncbi:DUF1028 domain-containing protein [Celerinatantimonas sp. MCCC 1A17872]|uniref:DUF1028 domain-containing protein n=1 Tax=Celerinatantimonas sp. MCCC 1A17872 TaxID=3177514 RepID=UPI0038C7AF27
MTISIAGLCPKTGQLGIAISSSSIAVGARCPWLLAGVGAVSSQNITLPSLGQDILNQLSAGKSAEQALNIAVSGDEFNAYRQVSVLDIHGDSACFSGAKTLGIHHSVKAQNCIAAGNMLANQQVIDAMANAFVNSTGELTARLIDALKAGLAKGGEAGPVHSAAVKVVDSQSWPLVDLRVDWAEVEPIDALEKLWLDYQPQMMDYVTRAIDPRKAPSYGVPGDE